MIRYPYRMFLFPLLFAFLAFNQDAPPPAAAVPLRLIVVNSAAEAAAIRRQLENGADFAVLAREKSTDATAADGLFTGEHGKIGAIFELAADCGGFGGGVHDDEAEGDGGGRRRGVLVEGQKREKQGKKEHPVGVSYHSGRKR